MSCFKSVSMTQHAQTLSVGGVCSFCLVEGADRLGYVYMACKVYCLERTPAVNGGATRSTSSLSLTSLKVATGLQLGDLKG